MIYRDEVQNVRPGRGTGGPSLGGGGRKFVLKVKSRLKVIEKCFKCHLQ